MLEDLDVIYNPHNFSLNEVEETYDAFEGEHDVYEDYEYAFEKDKDIEEDGLDNNILDFDFSEIRGRDFRKAFRTAKRKVRRPVPRKKRRRRRLDKFVEVKKQAEIFAKDRGDNEIEKVIVPENRQIIVEGISDFILDRSTGAKKIKEVGYYNGKRLQELVFTFNNASSLTDFELEIFNPSAPLDYLYSTSLNINDKIEVAGGSTAYTDVLFNLLANPTMIPSARFVITGPDVAAQSAQPMLFRNKNIQGELKVKPLNLNLKLDIMQESIDIVNFDIEEDLNRAFVPDGMDIISYKVLAGHTVTMAFFFKQVSLKKVFFKESRKRGVL
jgi:hypothetical protein